MTINITKPLQGGTIRAIASKSEAHRLLICAALSDKETFISCPESSEDIDATARCLIALGASVWHQNGGFNVVPIDRSSLSAEDKLHFLNCGESGATLRFMLPVCGALGVTADIKMEGRLPERPISDLYNEMVSHGCKLSEQGVSPLNCSGRLKSGEYSLPGNITSQYISGLLFALPLLEGDSKIIVTSEYQSRSYIDITLHVLRLFGIEVSEESFGFSIPGGQVFRSPETIQTGGDWSNAAFWLSAGAIGPGSVTCTNLDTNSKQGDRQITDILKRFGAYVFCEKTTVTVSPGKLRGIEIDAGDVPDLVPILAAVASVAEGQTKIFNAAHLRSKESDRLNTVTKMLTVLGADATETDDGLIINGKKRLTGGVTEVFGDHRIAMTATILTAACDDDVKIIGAEAVRKSYPGFYTDFRATLRGEFEEF
ncbi:MAG: 3-phosphoshikimate 1-carboxyvinyltransferase [Oscillospiraceae bacterium]|nr:3-phosphoshikimate 1-carboxyvinyltransferase [Oscillospiraceae bacterium]